MPPPSTAAKSLFPSAEDAIERQGEFGAEFDFHVTPESVDVKMGPPETTAASLLPSAEATTDAQFAEGAEFEIQIVPQFVEL